ncbi:MAG: carbohydrate-binding protein, partial [Anaerovoracaceae bacterium]
TLATKTELLNLIASAVQGLSDEEALNFKLAYPQWAEGIEITQDMIDAGKNRFQYGERLYKAIQPHTTQADWTPDITPALWTVIDETHAGTYEDPIPAVAGMEYVKGLYYIEDGTIYLMNRQGMAEGEAITLAYLPSQLVGQYFEVV